MAKPTIKFTAVPYKVGDYTGHRPLLENQPMVADLDFRKEVVVEKRLAMSAEELLHGVEMLGEVAAKKVAQDGRPRAITRLIKWNRFAKGNLDSPTGPWNKTCKAYVRAQLLSDAEKTIDGMFVNADGADAAIPRVTSLASPNGNAGEVLKAATIVANGANLAFSVDWGDAVTVKWFEGQDESAQAKTLEIIPVEQSATYLRFDWPEGLAEVPVGTTLTFSFRLHGGEGGAERLLTKTAKLVEA